MARQSRTYYRSFIKILVYIFQTFPIKFRIFENKVTKIYAYKLSFFAATTAMRNTFFPDYRVSFFPTLLVWTSTNKHDPP